jgi:large subunit ribosomal protein L15
MTNFLNTTSKVKIKKTRVGRGIGSGKGKTSGRGIKGQKSRSGVAIKSFEGGQMPLYRRLPKRGFNPLNKLKIAKINVEKIQKLIEKKIIKTDEKIDLKSLIKKNVINKSFKKIKILGNGEINSKLEVEADFSSKSAIEKIEKMGGKISLKKV